MAGKNYLSDLLGSLQGALRTNLMDAFTKGIQGMLPGLFGGGDKTTGSKGGEGGGGIAEAVHALIGKLDNLISKLDSAFGVKDALPANAPNMGGMQSGQWKAGHDPYNQWQKLGKSLGASFLGGTGGKGGAGGAGGVGGAGGNLGNQLGNLLGAGGGAGKAVGGAANLGAAGAGGGGIGALLGAGGGAAAGGAAAGAGGAAMAAAGGPAGLAIAGALEAKKLIDEHKAALVQRASEVGQAGKQAFQSDRAEDVGLNAISGARSGIKGAARAAGGPIAGGLMEEMVENTAPMMFLSLVEKGLEAVKFLRDFSKQLTSANLKIGEFSASMNAVGAMLKMQQITLSMEQGERRAGAAGRLVGASMATERMIAPLEDSWANIKADVMTSFHGLFQQVFGESITDLREFLESVGEAMKELPIIRGALQEAENRKNEAMGRHMADVENFLRRRAPRR